MSSSYEAFISYRRGDASALALWIRNRLQRYRLPAEVLKSLPKEMQDLHQRRPRVYLDRAYERPNADFLQEKLFPALDASKRLIVISSPSVFGTIRDASGKEEPNWLVQEIDRFFGTDGKARVRSVDVVLGPLAAEDRFPGRLAERARWDWVDLRAFNWWRAWGMSEALDAGFTKLAAGIYEIPDEALPLMRREERRRRRNIGAVIGLIFVMFIALGGAWWNARSAEQTADAERRFDVALRLVDTGSISRAVDAFAHLSDDGRTRQAEAKRILQWWSPRLAAASSQLAKIPDNSAFRWRGSNYVKAGGKLAGSYDGAPALVSALTSDGRRLVTFDSDHRLRVRTLNALEKPIFETQPLSATPGSISELFGGRVLLFEGRILSLQSLEDAENAQSVGGKFVALLSVDDNSYGVAQDSSDDAPGAKIDCATASARGYVQRFAANSPPAKDDGMNGVLTLRAEAGKQVEWQLIPDDNSAQVPAQGTPPASSCPPRVIAPAPQEPLKTEALRLAFPDLVVEKTLWKDIGPAAVPAELSICPLENDGTEVPKDCFAGDKAISIDPERKGDLESLLRDLSARVSTLKAAPERLFLSGALGNQWVGDSICEVGDKRVLGRCLVVVQTVRSTAKFLADDQLFAINSTEVQNDSFQLVDVRSLRTLSVVPSPGENLTDVAMSRTGSLMAALTRTGEVWLYRVDRAEAKAVLLQRYDLRTMIGAPVRQLTEAEANDRRRRDRDGEMFNAVAFVDDGRLMVTGANGGTILAEIPSGKIVWARAPVALLGLGRQQTAINAAADLASIFDEKSFQLLSLSSGAPLCQLVDLSTLASATADKSFTATGIVISDDGRVRISYEGRHYGLSDVGNESAPTWTMVPQVTGIARDGAQGPLELFLPRDR